MFTKYELDTLSHYLLSTSFDKPSGALSGHAIGEPIEKSIYDFLKKQSPNQFFKQYEFLNNLYLTNESCEDKSLLIQNHSLRLLLNRGVQATKNWSPKNLFSEKQNDTADIIKIYNSDGLEKYSLIDIKTFNTDLKGQPPNIISALKLAKLCNLLIENPTEADSFDICYYSVDWADTGNNIEVKDVHFVNIFHIKPEILYINWAAAMQIQFHPSQVLQEFDLHKTKIEWAYEYLNVFCKSVKNRIAKMEKDFLLPFSH